MEKRWWRVFWASFFIFFVSGLVEIIVRHAWGVVDAKRVLFIDALAINLSSAACFVALHRISPVVIEQRWKRTVMDILAGCAFLLVVPLPHALMYHGPNSREYKLIAFAAACLFLFYLAFLLFWGLRQSLRRLKEASMERKIILSQTVKSAQQLNRVIEEIKSGKRLD